LSQISLSNINPTFENSPASSKDIEKFLSFLMKIYGACVEKMDEDSLRYRALLDYLNPYIK